MPDIARYRTRGAIGGDATSKQMVLWSSCSNTTWAQAGSQWLFGTGVFESMSDIRHENFYERVKRGEIIFSPASHSRLEAVRSGGNGTHRRYSVAANCSGRMVNSEARDDGNQVENLYTVALGGSLTQQNRVCSRYDLIDGNEIQEKLYQLATQIHADRGRSSFNLSEDVAEAKKSFSLLSDAFKSVKGMALSARNKSRVKSAADAWLIWRYGVRPLISDIQGVLDGLHEAVGSRFITTRSNGTMSRSKSRVVTFTGSDQIVNIREDLYDDVTIRCMSLDEARVSILERKLFNMGLSTKALLTLPWELIPYSFVVDWFANVGNYINALAPSAGFYQRGSCYKISRIRETRITAVGTTGPGNWQILSPCTGSFFTREKAWSRATGLPTPRLMINTDFRFDTWTRCLDAFSLLMQVLR